MTQLNTDSGKYSLLCKYVLTDFPNYSVYTVQRLRKEWDILSTREQKHSAETIYAKVFNICECHPLHGIEGIRKTLWEKQGMRVARYEEFQNGKIYL